MMVHIYSFVASKNVYLLEKYGEKASGAIHTDFDDLWIQCGKDLRAHKESSWNSSSLQWKAFVKWL